MIHLRVFADATAGRAAAALVADRIAAGTGRLLLGCPGGRSPESTYLALADLVHERDLDLSDVVIVMMDDYLVPGLDGTLRREDPEALHSCERFAREQIVRPLNDAASAGHRIPPENVWLPDPDDPDAYDARITAAGGIEVFLLASGASDGHIAFNPPGSSPEARTRVVELPETTRRDNLATFPSFGGDVSAVPTHGVTVGLATIRDHSRTVVMLVHGADKAQAAARLQAGVFDPSWPATVVHLCDDAHLFLDQAASDAALAPTH